MSRSAPGRGLAGRICARLTLGAALLVSLAGWVSIERLFAPKAGPWHDAGGPTAPASEPVFAVARGVF